MPSVLTARISSTMSKKPLICDSILALSVGSSASRAKLAIREISEDVSDMVKIEVKPGVIQAESALRAPVVLGG